MIDNSLCGIEKSRNKHWPNKVACNTIGIAKMSSINITEIPPEELDVDEVAEKVVEPTKSGVDDVAGKKAEKAGFFKCFHFATAEDKTMIVFGVISAACQGACPVSSRADRL